MSRAPELRAGVVGYGVMGKARCYAYLVAPMLRRLPVTPLVRVISGRNEAAVAAAAAAYGVPEHTTDWRALVGRDDIDVVDICTPPGTHAQITAAAASAAQGRWVAVSEVTGPPAG
jgi:predicted dehydrogenase